MKRLFYVSIFFLLGVSFGFSQAINTPGIILGAVPYTACVGIPITFTAVDTSGNYTFCYSYWNWDDGSSAQLVVGPPQSIQHTYSTPGTYHVRYSAYDSLTFKTFWDTLVITVGPSCTNMDNFSGITYHDINGNGNMDGVDTVLPGQMIDVAGSFLTSDFSGAYSFNLLAGSYTFTGVPDTYWGVTEPGGASYSQTSLGNATLHPGLDFGFNPSSVVNDLEVSQTNHPLVPGFARWFFVQYFNHGTTIQNITLTLNFGPLFTVGTIYHGGVQSGNTVTWTVPNVAPNDAGWVVAVLQLSQSAVIGSTISTTSTVSPTVSDVTPANNTYVYDQPVVASWDPNNKEVLPLGTGIDGEVPFGTRFTYKINFQNTGNYYAQDVVLRDTLDVDLDQSTLEVLGASHNFVWYNDMGKLTFSFPNIMLPDSNMDEPGSHGWVRYRISPKAGLAEGTEIRNVASIYFDFNPAVVTNGTLNTLRTPTGVEDVGLSGGVVVAPNPFHGTTLLRFDNPDGEAHALAVHDVAGKLIFMETGIRGEEFVFDGSGLPAGLYMFRLMRADGVVRAGKMIVE